jgi:type III pantothenate kinase
MILELDCGNSFIKWRLLCKDSVARAGIVSGVQDVLAELAGAGIVDITHCRLVSVRSDVETQEIVDRLSQKLQIGVARAQSSRYLAGVTNAYEEYGRLGLDRWLAIVGAFSLCCGACMVIDVGTAVTVDLVAADGRHLGGYIAPGMALLRGQLLSHTRRIQYDPEEARLALSDTRPGSSTAEAVERGCLLMLRSYISSQQIQAHHLLDGPFRTYLTGGDALLVGDLSSVSTVPDLVFRGLALACP